MVKRNSKTLKINFGYTLVMRQKKSTSSELERVEEF